MAQRTANRSITRTSAPTYELGAPDTQGRMFIFTHMGPYRSGLEAVEAWRSQPRTGCAYVFEVRTLSRHGVEFGTTREIVATARCA